MSEPAHFFYDGNVFLSLSGKKNNSIVNFPNDLSINKIRNLIPIEVSSVLDNREVVLLAYIDYADNYIQLPKDTIDQLGDLEELFKKNILSYFVEQKNKMTKKYEEEFPPREIPRVSSDDHKDQDVETNQD